MFSGGITTPRLGIISDVSPEDSVSGQKLLYRLLSAWEPAALCVVDGNLWPSAAARRLPGVQYLLADYAPTRLFHTRFSGAANALWLHVIRLWTKRLATLVREFRADAILTVAHGHLFLAAAAVARTLNLPLHVLLHDDWPTITPGGGWPGSHLPARFKAVYSQAASRLCVSPYMEEEYRRRYGIAGSVLLPGREAGTPPGRTRVRAATSEGFVLAYAGSLPTRDYVVRLRQVADVLQALNGRLDLYTNVAPDTLRRSGLAGPSVRSRGFLPPRELHERIAASADALFLPMSFAAEDRSTMSVCFPSKLTEYTAIGLPVIVWGPAYSAGVRWVSEHGGGEAVVTTPDPLGLRSVLLHLASDAALSARLAGRLVAAGNEQFAFDRAVRTFGEAVRGSLVSP